MNDKLLIPVSIIIAGILVGAGFYLNSRNQIDNPNTGKNTNTNNTSYGATAVEIRPIDANDHVLGNPDARVVMIEYSDTECPFCKEYHKTLRALMTEYGASGKALWVYRHFPIAELHSKAPKEAEALECAAELGGSAKFWEYTNRIYEVTPANNGLDPKELLNIAKQVGLSSEAFQTCLDSNQYVPRVQIDINEAYGAGAQGTPFTILLDTKTGDTYPINGAYPYSELKKIIDLILQS